MKYSILFAALLAVVIAGCNKKEETSGYAPPPVPGAKLQTSDAPKAEPPKTEAPASAQLPAVAATSPTESKSAVGGGANPPGGEAKPAEGTAAPAGGQPAKKENK